MTAPLFLVDVLPEGGEVTLTGAEARHAAVVRRIAAGERVDVSDGNGTVVRCQVTSVDAQAVRLWIQTTEHHPQPQPRLVVVQALAKGERAEAAVEAMTEVGVDEIVPWAAARSVVRWDGDKVAKALARWRATAREAAKQSRRVRVPTVADLASTATVAARLNQAALAVVLHEAATTPLGTAPPPTSGDIVVVVGPEGGLTEDELATFPVPYRLGDTVLRTSTAGVVAVAVLLARTERWAR